MHQKAFDALGVHARYVPFDVQPAHLKTAFGGLVALGVAGVNVTLPHKTNVLDLLDDVDPMAKAIGAVNTIRFEEGWSCGWNTDAMGFTRALAEQNVRTSDHHVLVIGAGGAARAIVAGLLEEGARSICICARRLEQAEGLVNDFSSLAQNPLQAVSWLDLPKCVAQCSLIVQATSATLNTPTDANIFVKSLQLTQASKQTIVCDIVYKPRATVLLKEAAQIGLRTVDGLGMLLHQGALAFELWTNQKAPLEVMRATLNDLVKE